MKKRMKSYLSILEEMKIMITSSSQVMMDFQTSDWTKPSSFYLVSPVFFLKLLYL